MTRLPLAALVAVLTFAVHVCPQDFFECRSEIYCAGDVLSTVQMAQLFNDSKTFVDMKLKTSYESTVAKFRSWQLQFPTPSVANIQQFVDDNFDPEGSEFVPWTPTDHVVVPDFLSKVFDEKYRKFGQDLHDLWLSLGRKISDDVRANPDLYSIIYVPNPIIVPGGRFREFYYWDTYWVVLGLLHSEMFATTRGMLANFVNIVDRYGFVPNGGRIYYLGRSQPPMLIPMVKAYLDATNDMEFLRESIGSLEREFHYWSQESKTVFVKGHRLAIYSDRTNGPRPESYAEDVEIAQEFETPEERTAFFKQIKAGAESGMDFSSRWFINNGTNRGTLKDIQTTQIVPVELNAILYWNANLLAEFYFRIGNNRDKEREYREKAQEIYSAVQAVFWHEDVGAWLDWDLLNNQRRDFFVPTNLSPLWTNCFDQNNRVHLTARVMEYIDRHQLDSYPGGVPNSLEMTHEQWDFPNVWPPMQHILISGLRNLETANAREMAFQWAAKWVYTNYVGFNKTGSMFEKYSAAEIGLGGSGGEYDVQLGFGWSNGVVLDLLHTYGNRLGLTNSASSKSTALLSIISLLSIMYHIFKW